MLTEGISVTYQKDGNQRGDKIKLVDFDNVANNSFYVVNQFTVIENNNNKRPIVSESYGLRREGSIKTRKIYYYIPKFK